MVQYFEFLNQSKMMFDKTDKLLSGAWLRRCHSSVLHGKLSAALLRIGLGRGHNTDGANVL